MKLFYTRRKSIKNNDLILSQPQMSAALKDTLQQTFEWLHCKLQAHMFKSTEDVLAWTKPMREAELTALDVFRLFECKWTYDSDSHSI